MYHIGNNLICFLIFCMCPLVDINSMRVYHVCFISWVTRNTWYIVGAQSLLEE